MSAISPASKTDSPVRQNQFDFARRRLAPEALKVQKSRARKIRFREPVQRDLGRPVLDQKYFSSVFPKSVIWSRHPASQEGRFAIVMNVGVGCGGRGSVGRDGIAGRASLVS